MPIRDVLRFLRSVAPYLRARPGQTLLVAVTVIPTIAFTTIQPLLLKALVDNAILPHNSRAAILLVAALAILLIADAAGELSNRVSLSRLAIGIGNEIRMRLFERGVSRFSSDVDAVERVLLVELRSTLIYGMTIIVGAAVLISVQWRLALIALALIPLVWFAQRILGSRDDRAARRRQDDLARVVATAQENVDAQPVVRAFGLESILAGRFQAELANLTRATMRVGRLAGLQGVAINASGALLMVVSIGAGTVLALRGQLSVGALFAFFELLWWMVSAVQQLSDVVLPFQYAGAAMQRIDEVLRVPPAVIDDPHALPAPPLRSEIRFDHVSFGYLKDVNLSLPAGKRIAIVGASGSGKSTLLSLLMRFDDPASGAVMIDGVDLRRVQQSTWRSQIGTVFQESFLFNTTVRENIRFGNPNADFRAVQLAGRAAGVDDFLLERAHGYDTDAGERGARLSGGQKQRVAIARAIVRDPPILVLDEPTSALDPETEAAVNATLEKLSKGRTVISVTHRLSAITRVDRIVVLDRGRAAEQGTHEELLALGGLYARAFERQSGFAISGDGCRAEVEADRLRDIPFFARLNDATLAALANRFVTERHAAGDTIFSEGDEGDKLRIIVRGTVEIIKGAQQVALLQDGDFFGEIALLSDVPRTATAKARQASVLLALDREQFDNLMLAEPALRSEFEGIAAARRQQLTTVGM